MHVCSRPVAQPITALLNLYFPISTSRETKPVTQEIQLYNAVVFLANSCALSAPESISKDNLTKRICRISLILVTLMEFRLL